MIRSARLFAIILQLLLTAVLFTSWNHISQSQITKVQLRFLDATTQLAVLPDKVTIKADDGQFIRSFSNDLETGKPLTVKLPQGYYFVSVTGKDVEPMAFEFATADKAVLNYSIRLNALIPDQQVNYAILERERRSDRTLIIGYVADWNGNPLSEVEVICRETGEGSKTDARGFYRIDLSVDEAEFREKFRELPPNEAIQYYYRTLVYKKEGFKDLIIDKELVQPFGNGIGSHRMQAGEGVISIGNPGYFDFRHDEHTMSDGHSLRKRFGVQGMGNGQSAIGNRQWIKTNQKNFNSCIPQSIVVGFTPSGTTCCSGSCSDFNSDYGVFSIDEYSKHILRGEWLTTWNSLPNMAEGYKAAAVAIRSYAMARMLYNPSSEGFYQICSNACCQNYFIGSIPSYMASAVDATSGVVMMDGNEVGLTEYSSENNGLDNCHCVTGCSLSNQCTQSSGGQGCWQSGPCGDGFFQDPGNYQCFEDPVGTGHKQFGHGRGMSQYGSARWASGINLNAACESGSQPSHGYGTKNWQEILAHYYPSYTLNSGLGICGLDCSDVIPLECGVAISGNTVNGNSNILTYGCNISNNFTGPELVYSVNMEAGPFSVTLSNIQYPPDPSSSAGLSAIVLDGSSGCLVLDDPNNANSNCVEEMVGAGTITVANPSGGLYYILVDGLTEVPYQGSANNYDEDNGSFDLLVDGICSDCPHAYDDPCNALSVLPSANCTFTEVQNYCATTSSNPLPINCAGDLSENDIWIKTNAGVAGNLIIDTNDGTLGDLEMAVYSGVNCTGLMQLGCYPNGSSNDSNGWMPYADLSGLTPGEDIWIRLWDFGFPHEGTFGICISDPDAGLPAIEVCPTVLLQGSFDAFHGGTDNLMRTFYADNLLVPLSQPYGISPWNYNGSEAFPSFFNIPPDMVDWILVSLKDGADPSAIAGRKAAVLHADGSISMPDGSPVAFTADLNSGYYLELVHHGHLPIISANALFPDANNQICYDFSGSMDAAYRNVILDDDPMLPMNSVSGLYHVMHTANANFQDCLIDGNDINQIFTDYNASNFYGSSDVNMDGVVDINDLNLLLSGYNGNCHLNY